MDTPSAKRQRIEEGVETVGAHDIGANQASTNQALTPEGKTSEQRETAAVFGETQGPAGSAVSEDPKGPADSSSAPGGGLRPPEPHENSELGTVQSGDEQVSVFEPGIVAIEDKLHNGDLAGADAALTAFDKAKNSGTNENAVIDALEEAELQFEHAKGQKQASQGELSSLQGILLQNEIKASGGMAQRLSQRLETSNNGNPVPPQNLRKNGSKGAVQIEESNRQKIQAKMLESITKCPLAESMSTEQHRQHVLSLEDMIHHSCSSRSVYFSKAGNMSRLLSKLSSQEELEDLPRIASGLSKQVLLGVTTDMKPRDDTTGLQGIVPK